LPFCGCRNDEEPFMMSQVYISLGTNKGDRHKNLYQALLLLSRQGNITINHLSSIYETDPVGFKNQGKFLNMVIEASTSLSPQGLLTATSNIENQLGRVRTIRWGPRIIDLDILLYNQENINTD